MNRERLTILRDHLASLPDERFEIAHVFTVHGVDVDTYDAAPGELVKDCGTAACIAGWVGALFEPATKGWDSDVAGEALDLNGKQEAALFMPSGWDKGVPRSRQDAIAAIQSMLDSPDDDALPVWPSREGASA